MSAEANDASSAMAGSRDSPEGRKNLQHLTDEEKKAEKTERTADKTTNPNQTSAFLLPVSGSLSGLRDQRSSSDAYVHAVSKSRAAAAAALAKSNCQPLLADGCGQCYLHPLFQHHSPQLYSHRHRHHHQHHEHCQIHHSQCSIDPPAGEKVGVNEWNAYRHRDAKAAAPSSARLSHSQSSLARLTVRQPHTDPHSRSTSSLSRSARKGPGEEVTYVWRDGRVQIHQPNAASNGVGSGYHYSENRMSSGQHVEYLWQCGNVQKVIRGSNNELLSAELVPPRGPVKGMNFCVIVCLLVVMVVTLIALLFVLKVFH